MAKHTELPWVNGWGNGLTGPTTPAEGIVCGGKKWPYTVISKNRETIAIIPKQKDWILEANAAFIVKAVNNHYQLLEALKSLVIINDSTRTYDGFVDAHEKAREAIKGAEE